MDPKKRTEDEIQATDEIRDFLRGVNKSIDNSEEFEPLLKETDVLMLGIGIVTDLRLKGFRIVKQKALD